MNSAEKTGEPDGELPTSSQAATPLCDGDGPLQGFSRLAHAKGDKVTAWTRRIRSDYGNIDAVRH